MRKSRGIGSRAWEGIRRAALDRDNWRCRECGRAGAMQVHHVISVYLGGSDEFSNLVSLCRGCHAAKHQRRKGDWDMVLTGIVRGH